MNLTSTETPLKRLIVRWTAPKGFAAITVFFILTLGIEVLIVYAFQMFGLTDPTVWSATYIVPGINWTLMLSISPLFHLLPFSVIMVLLSSWIYLTKYTAFVPQRAETAKRVPAPTRREQEKQRFKSVRRFLKRVNRKLQRVSKTLKGGVQKIRGVSYISKRLFFARAAVRSAVTVLIVFMLITFVVFLAAYPGLIYNWTLNLYRGSPALLNFVMGVGQWLHDVGRAVSPLGGLGSAINNALLSVAHGFRHALEGFGESLTRPVVQLDLAGKYVLTQNLAAWTSALVALMYGVYTSSRPSRRSRGR